MLPSSGEVEKFSVDKGEGKRARLVSELLKDNESYAEHWITFWNDCFRNSYTRQYHGGGGKKITDWLKVLMALSKVLYGAER